MYVMMTSGAYLTRQSQAVCSINFEHSNEITYLCSLICHFFVVRRFLINLYFYDEITIRARQTRAIKNVNCISLNMHICLLTINSKPRNVLTPI